MYGFYGRLKAEFPSQIIVDVTEVCNLACIHCPHSEFKKSKHYGARMLDPGLNEKMVNEVAEFGSKSTEYLRYSSNGEPLIHPNIIEMLSCAVKNSGTTVTLTTNGTLMDEEKCEALIETGVDIIDISIDAYYPDTYSKIRVKGNLEITRVNVLKLLRLREESSKKINVVVSFVEQPHNLGEADIFTEYWKSHGVDFVIVRRLHSCAGAKPDIASKLRDKADLRRPCLYPWERVVLNPKGYLGFCPASWRGETEIADFKKCSIKDTWQGDFYKKLRDEHLNNNFLQNKFCCHCPDWKQVRWPDEGKSYADMVEQIAKH